MSDLVSTAITLVVLAGLGWWLDYAWVRWAAIVLGLLTLVGGVAEVAVLGRRRWRHTRYVVDHRQVVWTTGRLMRSVTTIPTSAVIKTELLHGPVLTRYGLAKLRLTTVMGTTELGPLDANVAESFRQCLSVGL